jgi:folate-binding protein YgfZ
MDEAYRLGQMTVLRFTGRDRCKVLNNLTTQDLRGLEPGTCKECFVTDPKGKTYGHGITIAISDSLLFATVPGQAEKLEKHFDRFIIMEDATVKDVSDQFTAWLFPNPKSSVRFVGESVDASECQVLRLLSGHSVLFHAPWIDDLSCVALLEPMADGELLARFREEVVLSDFVERKHWEGLRIQQFWPWYGQDMDDRNLPQELDRDTKAISFQKGCYLGQETIARLDALGQVQKKLVRISVGGSQLPNLQNQGETVLRSGDLEVGSLKSVGVCHGKIIGLAYLKRSHFASGTDLELGERRQKAQVC